MSTKTQPSIQIDLDKDTGLTVAHYKEPLKSVPSKIGHGYYGAIMISLDRKFLQCHICGKLYGHLGMHIRNTHRITTKDYRELFQLAPTTALVSEDVREAMKMRMAQYVYSLSSEERVAWLAKQREAAQRGVRARANQKHQPKESLERKNIKGTCPDQLLAKIQEVVDSLGHTPSRAEFMDATDSMRYLHLIKATFGSWSNALNRLGMKPKSSKKTGPKDKKTDDELLEALKIFYEDTGRVPTSSDAKRGFIPSESVYTRHFGGLVKARELAGITEKPIGRFGEQQNHRP